MASSDVSSVTNHFPTANEGFITTLDSTISSGAATVGLTSVSGLTNGDIFVGIIEPGTVGKEQTFTGTVDTGGNQITGVVWTRGSNTGHNAGVTIVDYVSGTGNNMTTKGLLVEHDQDGTHSDVTATSVTATTGTFTNLSVSGSATSQGWAALGDVPDTVTANGNKSYDLVFNSNDLTDTVTPGMRLETTRTVAAPDQCTSLDGSTQYYSKSSPSGMTFTDDFSVSAWVKVSSYASGVIASRFNGSSGWIFTMQADGTLFLSGYNASAGSYSRITCYQSVPLNKWVHVTAQLDMSAFTATTTTSYIMFDGVDVPAYVARAGTNPTALVQAGDFIIGAHTASTNPFPGKLAQVAVYSAKVTQATHLAAMNQGLAGTETSLISAYSFDGVITDLASTGNDLTANGSAVATNDDSPFGNSGVSTTLDYAIVMKAAFSTNTTLTVQVPEGCTIPTSGGVSTVNYSTQSVPYGFPRAKSKWVVETLIGSTQTQGSPSSGTWYNLGTKITIPIGAWDAYYEVSTNAQHASTSIQLTTLSTANNSESDSYMTGKAQANSTSAILVVQRRTQSYSLSAATPYYLNISTSTSSTVSIAVAANSVVRAENSYL